MFSIPLNVIQLHSPKEFNYCKLLIFRILLLFLFCKIIPYFATFLLTFIVCIITLIVSNNPIYKLPSYSSVITYWPLFLECTYFMLHFHTVIKFISTMRKTSWISNKFLAFCHDSIKFDIRDITEEKHKLRQISFEHEIKKFFLVHWDMSGSC